MASDLEQHRVCHVQCLRWSNTHTHTHSFFKEGKHNEMRLVVTAVIHRSVAEQVLRYNAGSYHLQCIESCSFFIRAGLESALSTACPPCVLRSSMGDCLLHQRERERQEVIRGEERERGGERARETKSYKERGERESESDRKIGGARERMRWRER